jgi:hypothetical protein
LRVSYPVVYRHAAEQYVQVRVVTRKARRIGATCFAFAVFASASAACGGDPGSENLHDGASNGRRTVPTAAPSPKSAPTSGDGGSSQSTQPAECWAVAEGCRCTHEGEVTACQSQRLDFGDYVTCAGERQCVQGTWGPCIATHFVGH